MKLRMMLALAAIGGLLVTLPLAATAGELDEAREAVQESSTTAVDTLDRVSDQVADDAKDAIRHARERVLASRERALQALDQVEDGRIAERDGLATAIEATENQQTVLQEVLGKVPDKAKAAIEHAIEASRHGNTTVRALHAGSVGRELSGHPDVSQRPELSRPRDYGPSRDVGRPLPSAPSGPRSGFRPSR